MLLTRGLLIITLYTILVADEISIIRPNDKHSSKYLFSSIKNNIYYICDPYPDNPSYNEIRKVNTKTNEIGILIRGSGEICGLGIY